MPALLFYFLSLTFFLLIAAPFTTHARGVIPSVGLSVMALEVLGILILENESANRLAVKYNVLSDGLQTLDSQREFEKELTKRSATCRDIDVSLGYSRYANILLTQNNVTAVVGFPGFALYVVSTADANELLLADVCENVAGGIANIIAEEHEVSSNSIIKYLDQIFVLLDEVSDGPLLFEMDCDELEMRRHMIDDEGNSGGLNLSGQFQAIQGVGSVFSGFSLNSLVEQTKNTVARNLLG